MKPTIETKTKELTRTSRTLRGVSRRTRSRGSGLAGVRLSLKRILVTTDFSDASKKALPHAAAYASSLGSEIALLNVIEPPSRFVGLESVPLVGFGDVSVGRVYRGLEVMKRRAFGPKQDVKTYVRTGKPHSEIIKAAQELETDLLIMATHGFTGLKHTLMGSTTERVLRQAPCPILTVRGKGVRRQEITVARILLCTDFSENSFSAIPLAESLAGAFGSSVTLLHVVQRFPIDAILGTKINADSSGRLVDQARSQLRKIAETIHEQSGLRADVLVKFGTPYSEIINVAKELAASLIVLATHGYSGLKRMYLGSVAERVLRHSQCPVLVTRDRGR